MNRRDFLITTATGAAAILGGVAAIEAEAAKVTITHDLLVSWGACERYRKIFRRDYPDGVTGTAAEIAAIPKAEYDQLWVLHAMAQHLDGAAGDDALALLVERADPSRLAKAVVEVTRRDTGAALARLCESGDAQYLAVVLKGGTPAQAAEVAPRFKAVANAVTRAAMRAELPIDRRELLEVK